MHRCLKINNGQRKCLVNYMDVIPEGRDRRILKNIWRRMFFKPVDKSKQWTVTLDVRPFWALAKDVGDSHRRRSGPVLVSREARTKKIKRWLHVLNQPCAIIVEAERRSKISYPSDPPLSLFLPLSPSLSLPLSLSLYFSHAHTHNHFITLRNKQERLYFYTIGLIDPFFWVKKKRQCINLIVLKSCESSSQTDLFD